MAFYRDDGKFYIVNLMVDNTEQVAIVPDFWFHSNGWCVYPNNAKGTSSITSRAIPNKAWLCYPSRFIKCYESYKEARPHLVAAQEKSDINTASEAEMGKGRRKKIAKIPFSPMPSTSTLAVETSSSEDSDLDSASQHLSPIDLPQSLAGKTVAQDPKVVNLENKDYEDNTQDVSQSKFLQLENNYSNSQLLNESTEVFSTIGVYNSFPNVEDSQSSLNQHSSPIPRNSTPIGNEATATPVLVQQHNGSVGSSMIVQKENRHVHFGNNDQFSISPGSQLTNSNRNIDQHILKALKQIQEEQKKFDAKLTLIDKKVENYKSTTEKITAADFSGLPISFENLDDFEENLTMSDAKYNNLVVVVKSIGGTSLGDAVKRTMNKILHVDAQANCNWNGHKRGEMKKHGLASSPITKAVFEGIRQISEFEGSTDSELEVQMKKAIRHAPEKEKKRKRTRSPTLPPTG